MKEIFNINRFWVLTVKYYRENMRTNLIFLAVMFVITFAIVNKWSFLAEYTFIPDAESLERFINQYKSFYATNFKGLLVIFCMVAAFRSLKDFTSPSRCFSALLLPASNFEKYLLAVLHSTIVVGVVFIGLFYATTAFTSTYRYVGLKQMNFTVGWLGSQEPVMGGGQEVYHTKVGNVFSLNTLPAKINGKSVWEKVVVKHFHHADLGVHWNLNLIWWTYLISVCMWGSITFRRRSALLTFLIHAGVIAGVSVAFVFLGDWLVPDLDKVTLYDLTFMGRRLSAVVMPSAYVLLLFYVFVIGYQWVIWKKLKSRQLG